MTVANNWSNKKKVLQDNQALKWYYDQIFTPWYFERITKSFTKEWKRRLPFVNICISSGDI